MPRGFELFGFPIPDRVLDRISETIARGVQDGLADFNPYLLIDSLCKPPSLSAIQYLTWTADVTTAAINSSGDPFRLPEAQETLLLYYAFVISIVDAVAPLSAVNLYTDAIGFVPNIALGPRPIFGGDQNVITLGSQENQISFALFARHAQSFLVGASEAGSLSGIIPVLLRVGPAGDLEYGFSKGATQHAYRVQVALAYTTIPVKA
jgi:hypothetical protein